MQGRHRVVVTGIGLRSPIGNDIAEMKRSLIECESGITYMSDWEDVGHMKTKVAGLCREIDEKAIERKFRRSMGRVSILAALAARDAASDAGLGEDELSSPDCGISFGSTSGSATATDAYFRRLIETRSLKGLHSSSYLKFMSHTCAANLAMMFKAKGPVIASCTACVSGSQGIGFGAQSIAEGRCRYAITGGAEEMFFWGAGVFDIMKAASHKYNDHPDKTPRPFDAARDGLVVGEGAGCLLLEDYESAINRDAAIYAEILGYGTNCDGSHITSPSAEGMAGAMKLSLKDASLNPDQIGHVNAHATATPIGDIAEGRATHEVFGSKTPISALKGYMGHTLGACGALESIATIIMLNDGFAAACRNLDTPDQELPPLDLVMNEARELNCDIAMNNNFAFGGINTSLIFSRI